ncbi:MAG: RNA 3'-terminal phosphate cyclase [Nitrospirales bacterium]
MIQIDGAQYSGSGTIVRQAVMFAALTGQPVRVVNVRARRHKPGLRHQHVRVVDAIGQLVNGRSEGLFPGSMEVVFQPGSRQPGATYRWDIGSAGSTTMLASAVLPVLAYASEPVQVELQGGLFQDFAPSVFHLQQVMLPLLKRMRFEVQAKIERPGYVPRGEGILRLAAWPSPGPLRGLMLAEAGPVMRLWGIALATHLAERRVGARMADTATRVLAEAGYQAEIEIRNDTSSLQPGAVLALFADLGGDIRLGADQAGALRRSAESIGRFVARRLLEEVKSGATLDRFAADQIIPFAALAAGESRFRIPMTTDHVLTNAWLANLFLGAEATVRDHILSVKGVGYQPGSVTS